MSNMMNNEQHLPDKKAITHQQSDHKKVRGIRGVVIKAKRETKDTWTLDLFISDRDKDYLAGQFITISPHQFLELDYFIRYFEYHKGKKEQVRAYSLTSAPHEKYLSITIKPEPYIESQGAYPPLLAPLLASPMLVGREIEFSGYTGAYVMPEHLDSEIDHVVHLVAGSGIVPSYSIIKDELENGKRPGLKHTLIYVNKKHQDIIFHQELNDWQKRFPHNLDIKYFLTQEPTNGAIDGKYRAGRPSIEQLGKLIPNPKATLFFACGPAVTKWQRLEAKKAGIEPSPRFMEWVYEATQKLGVDKKRLKREIYG